jgi:F-type H+-transporting ATPase subunit gamma
MASLKAIKEKRHSINKTRKVTRAMEAVSAVKMRKGQERALDARVYARAALRILSQVADSVDLVEHPLTAKEEEGATGIILVTSDKGLAGSLNSAVIKHVEEFLRNKDFSKGGVVFLCLGKRGYEFATRRGYEVVYYETNIDDDVPEQAMRELTEKAISMIEEGTVRKMQLVYTNFKSTFEQEAVMRRLLPLSSGALNDIVGNIVPAKGMFADVGPEPGAPNVYTIEPTDRDVFNEVLPILVNIAVFHSLLESKASEHSARMVAMKNATDKAGELSHELQLSFNKARQAAITREVSEITSGVEAMK